MKIENKEQLEELLTKSHDKELWNQPEYEDLQEALTFAVEEIKRLEKRLEVNPEAPEWDGIACRDVTIAEQGKELNRINSITAEEIADQTIPLKHEMTEETLRLADKFKDYEHRYAVVFSTILEGLNKHSETILNLINTRPPTKACDKLSVLTYVTQNEGDGDIMYAGHYKCCAEKILKGAGGCLTTWQNGKIIKQEWV